MKYVFRLFFLLLILVVFGPELPARAQKRKLAGSAPVPAASSPQSVTAQRAAVQRRIETFRKVWTTLQQNYFDPTFNKLDWNKIKLEFEPRVRAAKADNELYALLNEMIARLQRSHLAIIAPEIYQAIERAKIEAKAREAYQSAETGGRGGDSATPDDDLNFDDPLTQYGIGVELRLLADRFVITRIVPNSAAEYAGLKTGYVIEKVNGVSLTSLLRRIETQNANATRVKRYLPFEIVGSFLNGEKGSYVSITYADESETQKEIRIRRERLKSETVSLGRNFPERQLQFESASLSDDVGYIKFNLFALPIIGKFCDAIGAFRNKKAVIIDLRGNMGGIVASMVALAGMLTDTSIDLGTSIYRDGDENLSASAKVKNYKGKVVILVDNQTVSAAEIFAASMQDARRAVVIGDKTAGEALPSVAVDLPTGAVLLYPIANYISPSGKLLEGAGVTPNVTRGLTRESLLKGKDDQIAAAMAAISDGTEFALIDRAKAVESEPPNPPTAAPTPPYVIVAKSNVATISGPKPPAAVDAPLPPPPVAKLPAGRDAASLKIFREFVDSIGGKSAVEAIGTYTLTGRAELLVKGTKNEFDLNIYFDKSGKYSEVLRSAAAGEIRDVRNGTANFVQTDYGLTRDMPPAANTGDLDILAPIRNAANADFYSSLKFVGTFSRDGRPVNLIDARTKDGYYLALAFDVETKELVSFTGSYYALNFGDYRKAGDVKLPYRIERERIMNITIDQAVVNTPIDDAKFTKKQNCFDREN